uniref:Uncharacterized protein n=1 Tax=Neogobius melanostomus TaxID=47308 RepID=A0A8C6TDT4_9GOBI
MASSTQSSSEEQFLCSICLEVFSEPVSTPCGHNFCKCCISQTWDTNESCPAALTLYRPPPLSTALPCTAPAGLKDWSSVSFEPQTCEGSVARALSELEISLSREFNKVFKQLPPKDQLRRVQQFAVDVTLDPNTAYPYLVLSKDLKQVHCGDVWKKLPDSSQRFTKYANVLGKQSFSSGRFYFEVQVKGKTMWDLGVARESVKRKGEISLSPKDGYWIIGLRDRDEYEAFTKAGTTLSPQRPPQKVGVFVDYGAGLVSFYDVDSADLLYSFTNFEVSKRFASHPKGFVSGRNPATDTPVIYLFFVKSIF